MNKIGANIFALNLQIKRGNRQKRVFKNLNKNLNSLKTLSNIYEFNEVYDKVFRNNDLKQMYIQANLFPVKIKDISRYREVHFTGILDYELRWQMKLMSKYSSEINEFILYKTEIEALILQNKYQKALSLLHELMDKYGVSCWLLETEIFLFNKLNKNIEKNNMLNDENSFVNSILRFYDMRSANNVSSRDYYYFVKRQIIKFEHFYPKNDIVSFYNYLIAPFSFSMNQANVLSNLKYISDFPLFDRYLYLVDVCRWSLVEKNNENIDFFRKHINYMDNIIDPSIYVLKFILDTQINRKEKYNIEDSLIGVKNNYILGKLDECYVELIEYIKNNSLDLSAYNLYIEVCQLLGKEILNEEISDNKIMILKNLNSIYSMDINYDEAVDEIEKLCFCNVYSSWARTIHNNIHKFATPYNSDSYILAKKYSYLQTLTFETLFEYLAEEDVLDYLDTFNYINYDYVKFLKLFKYSDYINAVELCKLSALKKLVKITGSKKYFDYHEILNCEERLVPIYKIKYLKLMWHNISEFPDIEESIDFFLEMFMKNENFAIIAPVEKFVNHLDSCAKVNKNNLRVPILYYIYTEYFNDNRRDELSYICEDFLFYNNVEKPSEIAINEETHSEDLLIFFLRYLCIPQIIGSALLCIDNSKELAEERISICQILLSIDSDNANTYENEIRDITHQIFINDGINKVESSKIHVNTEGIKSRISKKLRSDYSNYMYIRNQNINNILESIKKIYGREDIKILTLDESQIFSEIVKTIRNEFVSGNEYGLDGYLSMNVRHGILSDQLRRPLGNVDLLVSSEKKCVVNERWLYKLKMDKDKKQVISAIIKFNEETEKIIEDLRKKYIQISTEENKTEGIFDYSLNDRHINYLKMNLTENMSFEEFIENIFEYLWKITDRNLESMRGMIIKNVKTKYIEAFTVLRNEIVNITKGEFPEVLRFINQARDDMDAELEKISKWFRRTNESEFLDFDLEVAFQIGLNMVQNIHPEVKIVHKKLYDDKQYKIPGVQLKNYTDIFYILLDNVCKYAQELHGIKNIEYELKVCEDFVYIKILNDYNCSSSIENEKNKIKTALNLIDNKGYLARVNQEGGSGIPKIYKILSIDLDKRASIKAGFIETENKFFIEINGEKKDENFNY